MKYIDLFDEVDERVGICFDADLEAVRRIEGQSEHIQVDVRAKVAIPSGRIIIAALIVEGRRAGFLGAVDLPAYPPEFLLAVAAGSSPSGVK